jgi:hypothetical protein
LPGSAVPELNLFLGGFEAFCGESMYVHKSLVLDFVIFLKEEEQCMYAYMHALFQRIMHKKTTLSYKALVKSGTTSSSFVLWGLMRKKSDKEEHTGQVLTEFT